jgi:hypothetical protein
MLFEKELYPPLRKVEPKLHKCKERKCKERKCKEKCKKLKNNYETIINKNIIRIILKNVPHFVRQMVGYYYSFIHMCLAILGLMVLLFSNNIIHLACLLVVIILDALSIVFLHDCPLTKLEEKYLGFSSVSKRKEFLKNLGIMYECNHDYESQLEVLINAWTFAAIKMLVLICKDLYYV